MEAVLKDERFARIAKDKKFRGVAKKQRKVKIDKRFQSMFKDEKFVAKCSVDKRGRPKNFSSQENFKRYYALNESDDDDDDSDSEDSEADNIPTLVNAKDSPNSGDDDSDDEGESQSDGNLSDSVKAKIRNDSVDYARGEGTLFSDSSSDESSSDDDDEGDEDRSKIDRLAAEGSEEVFDKWGEMDGDAERTEEATRRLAVCNMDWDRVQAEDLFLALSSFCPTKGRVEEVKVYLSDFGRERLAEEEKLGPAELRRRREQEEKDVEDYLDLVKSGRKAKKAEEAAMARVRQYQVNRLKYYYAVAKFDSVKSANRVYEECDGMEYELSATRFDLRFVPDDMTFDKPVASVNQPPDPAKYQPKTFFTTALQQGKVELTWDENDPQREENMRKAFDLVDKDGENEDDLSYAKNLIASSSEDEDEDVKGPREIASGSDDDEEHETNEKDMIARYRALVTELQNKEEAGDKAEGNMEISWQPEADEGQSDDGEASNHEDKEKGEEELTPWEKYLQKKKEKRKKKKNVRGNENDTDDELPNDIDLSDPFFAQELRENVQDPESNTGSKRKKMKKKDKKLGNNVEAATSPEEKSDLQLLVMDSDDDKEHFNYKTVVEEQALEGKSKKKNKWKKKGKSMKDEAEAKKEDNFDVNVDDERFSALYTRPEFNIDPSDPNFKKTKAMGKLIDEKQKRKQLQTDKSEGRPEASSKKSRLDPEVTAALKSVKNKWKKNSKKKIG